MNFLSTQCLEFLVLQATLEGYQASVGSPLGPEFWLYGQGGGDEITISMLNIAVDGFFDTMFKGFASNYNGSDPIAMDFCEQVRQGNYNRASLCETGYNRGTIYISRFNVIPAIKEHFAVNGNPFNANH